MAERTPEQITGMKNFLDQMASEQKKEAGDISNILDSSILSADFVNQVLAMRDAARFEGILDGINWREGDGELPDIEEIFGLSIDPSEVEKIEAFRGHPQGAREFLDLDSAGGES